MSDGNDLPGGPGGFDIGALLGQAAAMQEQMAAAQQHAAETIVEGQAGGGVVKIAVTGGLEIRSVKIDPKVVDPDDVEMLEDLVLAAFRDAVSRANEVQTEAMSQGMPDLGGLLGGLGGGGLGGGGLPGLPEG